MGNWFGKPKDTWSKTYSREYPIHWALIQGEWYCDDLIFEDGDYWDGDYWITYKKRKKGEHVFFTKGDNPFIPGDLIPLTDKGNNLLAIWRIISFKHLDQRYYQLKCQPFWRKASRLPRTINYCLDNLRWPVDKDFPFQYMDGPIPKDLIIYICILEGKCPKRFEGEMIDFLKKNIMLPQVIVGIIFDFLIK